jgi:hypothetical protein
MAKLTHREKHLISLIRKGRDETGWAKVSGSLWLAVVQWSESIPDLVELKRTDEGGFIKLTDKGEKR